MTHGCHHQTRFRTASGVEELLPHRITLAMFGPDSPATQWIVASSSVKQTMPTQTSVQHLAKIDKEAIASLKRAADWDGLGAKAITNRACDDAIAFLDYAVSSGVPQPDYISPSSLGAVSFEWHRDGKKWYVRVHSRGADGCFYQWKDAEGHRGQGRYDISTATRMIKEFASIK
jgi:hypothetical protein